MVKKIALILLFGIMLAAARADEATANTGLTAGEMIRQGWGLGVIIGEPTGLSAKKWITDRSAVDFAAAWSFVDFDAFQLHLDYLWHNYDLIKTRELHGQMAVFYGIGGRIKLKGGNEGRGVDDEDEDTRLGVRVPFGLSYALKESPLELFVEVVPFVDVVPEAEPGLGMGLGARYYISLR